MARIKYVSSSIIRLACRWKNQKLGKFYVGKLEAGKFSLMLESTDRSWLVLTLVRTFQLYTFEPLFGLSNIKLSNYSMFSTTCQPWNTIFAIINYKNRTSSKLKPHRENKVNTLITPWHSGGLYENLNFLQCHEILILWSFITYQSVSFSVTYWFAVRSVDTGSKWRKKTFWHSL